MACESVLSARALALVVRKLRSTICSGSAKVRFQPRIHTVKRRLVIAHFSLRSCSRSSSQHLSPGCTRSHMVLASAELASAELASVVRASVVLASAELSSVVLASVVLASVELASVVLASVVLASAELASVVLPSVPALALLLLESVLG